MTLLNNNNNRPKVTEEVYWSLNLPYKRLLLKRLLLYQVLSSQNPARQAGVDVVRQGRWGALQVRRPPGAQFNRITFFLPKNLPENLPENLPDISS